jgi:hypothetical protein
LNKRKEIVIFLGLLLTLTTLPIIASSTEGDVTLGNCYTTDWVNGWQDTGLRIKEWPIDGEVYAYVEVYADNLQGHIITHRWWYDNGTGLENKWEWDWEIPEPWSSAWSYTYWQIGLDYGKGWGYIEVLADGESIGTSNNYAMDNTQPDKPTITGPAQGNFGEETEYTFVGTDPDGFDIFYIINWGDETGEEIIGPINSGEEKALTHTWAEEGTYQITCKVRDLVDSESEETILEVTMPKHKGFHFNILERLLERFPNAFPILRYLLAL